MTHKIHSAYYTHHDQKFQKQGNIVCRYLAVFYAVMLMECCETTLTRNFFFGLQHYYGIERFGRYTRGERTITFLDGATNRNNHPPDQLVEQNMGHVTLES